MDIYAYLMGQEEKIETYLLNTYGEIPRFRGVRFMKTEKAVENPDCEEDYVFNKYVGQDVIYIHTRCGHCDMGYGDKDSNYVYCGGKDFEDRNKDLFLDHITNNYDSTYCTHYFKAVDNMLYREIIANELKD